MTRSATRFAIALAAMLLIGGLSGSWSGVLAALPAILLLACLAFGRYPGDAAIDRLRSLRHGRRSQRASAKASAARRPRSRRGTTPRGTSLLAFKRAVRPPPARALTA